MPDTYDKTGFDENVTRFAEECFRIAGWMALAAGLLVAGKKLSLLLALVLGLILTTILALYVGVKASELMWRAFRWNSRGKFGRAVIEIVGPLIGALSWYSAYTVAGAIATSELF